MLADALSEQLVNRCRLVVTNSSPQSCLQAAEQTRVSLIDEFNSQVVWNFQISQTYLTPMDIAKGEIYFFAMSTGDVSSGSVFIIGSRELISPLDVQVGMNVEPHHDMRI